MTIHPYFTGKARHKMRVLGLDPDDAGPLAEWAQRAHDERAEGTGVVITRDGTIVAATHLVRGRVSGWYVTTDDRRRLGLSHEIIDMALAGIKRATGQDCAMVSYWDVCTGHRASEVTT